jgi:hypothetical protein
MTGTATSGCTAGTGSTAAAGRGRRELNTHLGVTGAHESFTVLFVTFRTLYCRVTTEYQFFKIFTTVVAMKFKNGHVTGISLKYF